MEKSAFDEYISGRYKAEIDWYDGRANENQSRYRVLQWSLIILSALTPVFIAIDFAEPARWLKWVPLVTSVLVSLISAALKTFKYEENWLNFRTTCETLKKEIHFYRADTGDYERAEDKEAAFVERVEALISRENSLWLNTSTRKEQDRQTV